MSNHLHLDVTDPHGVLPEFKTDFNAVVARAVNAMRGRFDKFWSEDRPCDVRLLDDETTLANMAYTLANPTDAGLVKWGRRWPGVTTAGLAFGTELEFSRPDFFFDAGNDALPDVATVTVTRPAVFLELSDEQLHTTLVQQTRDLEVRAQQRLRAEGRRFLGEARVCRQRWWDSPRSREARFSVAPSLSARSKWTRRAFLQRDREWEADYADARERMLAGDAAVRFPVGTYWLRRFVGVLVAPVP